MASLTTNACSGDERARDTEIHWAIKRVWTLGDQRDTSVLLSSLYPFGVSSNGNNRLYALGGGQRRVLQLDSDGHLIGTLGREGSGPGELVDPWAISTTPSGEIDVVDLGARRVVRWTAGGELLEPVPIRDAVDQPQMALLDSALWHTTWTGTNGSRSEYQLVASGPAGDRVLARLPRAPRKVADFPSCHAAGISVQPLFAPVIHWDAGAGRVAVNAGPEYRIEVYDRAGAARIIQRPVPPRKATRELALEEARDWMLNNCRVPPEEVVRAAGYQPVIPVVRSLALSPSGELWVQRLAADGLDTRIDVFESGGTYLGTLPLGSPWPVAFLANDRIVALETDSLDVPRLVGYDITR